MALTRNKDDRFYGDFSSAQVDATSTNSSDAFPTAHFQSGTYQCVWSTMTGTLTAELQTSNDGTNWDTVTSTSFTTSGASGSRSIIVDPLPGLYNRITITAAGSVASKLDVRAVMKRGAF